MLLLTGWGSAAAVAASSSALTGVSRVIVAGDSLADVGTFGFKFTVQDAANPAGFPVFPELVAGAYGLSAACSHYMDNGAGGVIRGEIPHARTLPSAVAASSTAATVRRASPPNCAMPRRPSAAASTRATSC